MKQMFYNILCLVVLLQYQIYQNNFVLSSPTDSEPECTKWDIENSLTFGQGSYKYYSMTQLQITPTNTQVVISTAVINVTTGSLNVEGGYIFKNGTWVNKSSTLVINGGEQKNVDLQFIIAFGSYGTLKIYNSNPETALAAFINVESLCFGAYFGTTAGGSTTGTTTTTTGGSTTGTPTIGGSTSSTTKSGDTTITTTSSSVVTVTSSTASVNVDTEYKLSDGAKAGIASFVILVVVGCGILVYVYIYRRKHHSYRSIH